ncbi:MAG: alpha/beta hydrolase family protein, partial [Acetobacteraceae bacterium]
MLSKKTLYWPLMLFGMIVAAGQAWAAMHVPRAIYTDPPHDTQHPARMVVLHVPSGGVKVNGIAYLAEGAGRHPTVVLFVGLPGNEKNLDLAQAVRRAGWNAVAFFYRGSWGSPGIYRFSHNLEDARAVLAYLRATPRAHALGIDTSHIVLLGHSMGGWVAAETAAHDQHIAGLVLISAADMGDFGSTFPHAKLLKLMADNMESLSGVTPEQLADELQSHASRWRFDRLYGQLAHVPLIVITSDPLTAPADNALVTALRTRGDREVTAIHMNTDHPYSDHRIALESAVINWLQTLP